MLESGVFPENLGIRKEQRHSMAAHKRERDNEEHDNDGNEHSDDEKDAMLAEIITGEDIDVPSPLLISFIMFMMYRSVLLLLHVQRQQHGAHCR